MLFTWRERAVEKEKRKLRESAESGCPCLKSIDKSRKCTACVHIALFFGERCRAGRRAAASPGVSPKNTPSAFFMVSMTMVWTYSIIFVHSVFSLWAPTKWSLPSEKDAGPFPEVDAFMRSVQNGFDFKNTLAFRDRHYVDTGLKALQVEGRNLIHNMSKAWRSWTQGEHANRMTSNQVLPALRSMHSRKSIKRTE